MKTSVTWLCLLGIVFATASVHAQDVVVGGKKRAGPRYELKLPTNKDKDAKSDATDRAADEASLGSGEPGSVTGTAHEEEDTVDPQLADAVAAKIRFCYAEEAKKEISAEDKALVEQYKVSLVRELESGMRPAGCKAEETASSDCLAKLEAMTCEEFAEGIKAKRWDKHLLPEDRAAISEYTGNITQRKSQCRAARGQESDPVEQQVESDKLGVVAAMNITVGRCQLDMRGQASCRVKLSKLACPEIELASQRNKLVNLCPQFLRCKSSGPSVE